MSSLCSECGGEIDFRHIDGRIVPIHRSGHCPGVGVTAAQSIGFQHEKDICHPTKCPECRRMVFFIRHNGGSLWVDSLGWPWPKHPCFQHGLESPLETLAAVTGKFSQCNGAIISRVVFSPGQRTAFAFITTPRQKTVVWLVREVSHPNSLVGALVVILSSAKKMWVSDGCSYSIEEPTFPCPICDAPVLRDSLDRHFREAHHLARCFNCGILISERQYGDHLRRNQCQVPSKRKRLKNLRC